MTRLAHGDSISAITFRVSDEIHSKDKKFDAGGSVCEGTGVAEVATWSWYADVACWHKGRLASEFAEMLFCDHLVSISRFFHVSDFIHFAKSPLDQFVKFFKPSQNFCEILNSRKIFVKFRTLAMPAIVRKRTLCSAIELQCSARDGIALASYRYLIAFKSNVTELR